MLTICLEDKLGKRIGAAEINMKNLNLGRIDGLDFADITMNDEVFNSHNAMLRMVIKDGE